jgi:N-sulfoglucosamine sulfohydrolase
VSDTLGRLRITLEAMTVRHRGTKTAQRHAAGTRAVHRRLSIVCGMLSAILVAAAAAAAERPNILWISAEDLSAGTIGCYGGAAHTPRIDRLARDGLRFDAAFAAAPVCAPSRSGIITGVMPTSLGSLPMRCRATPPPHVQGLPRLLRDAGYYCSNNAKTDYNLGSFDAGWHESGGTAHWRRRPDRSQPFFAVFNLGVTHESGLFGGSPAKVRGRIPAAGRRRPEDVRVPAYYPDTPVIRTALSQRLELAAALDTDVSRILDELAADGLADDTIVVFWGDHGEGIPHGKRSLTEHGLRVPLVIHVPPRFATAARLPGGGPPAGTTSSLASLIDLAPTTLDLAGLAIPAWMEGRSMLGPHAQARDVVIGCRDRMDSEPGFGRTARDGRFRYVRHFMPWLGGDDLPPYADGVAITGELRRVRDAGALPPGAAWFARTRRPVEELYDVTTDPDEVHDLAADPAHRRDLERLRAVLDAWMRETRDTGVLPEPLLRREAAAVGSEWQIFHARDPKADAAVAVRHGEIQAMAWAVAEPHDIAFFRARLAADEPAIRFWSACGIGWTIVQGGHEADRDAASASLTDALADREAAVRIAAATWLIRCRPDAPAALELLGREMLADDPDIRFAALSGIEQLGPAARSLWGRVAALSPGKNEEYSRRIVAQIRDRLAADRPAP